MTSLMTKIILALGVAALVACGTSQEPQQKATFKDFAYSGNDARFETAISSDEYLNPIMSGFYPDPSVTRAGDDFYLVTSTFSYFPGVPVFTSKDLVNWRQIGHVIDRPGMIDVSGLETSRGIFAPTIEYHEGMFYLTTTCVDCGGNFISTTTDPSGPWSDPIWVPEVGGIDPSIFFDTDGRLYMINNDAPESEPRYDGHRAIWFRELDRQTLQPISEQYVIVDGGAVPEDNPIWIEGPHLYHIGGSYYLSMAEGGTSVNHTQVVFKSDRVGGPYVPFEGNPILTQKHLPMDRPEPVSATGHADLIQDADGQWWSVFLGTRPYSEDYYNTGRETFLMPVRWEDGWPIITSGDEIVPGSHKKPAPLPGENIEIETNGNFETVTDFTEPLGFNWISLRAHHSAITTTDAGLEIDLRDISESLPVCRYRRQQHIKSTVQTHLDVSELADGQLAGIIIQQNQRHYYLAGYKRISPGHYALEIWEAKGTSKPKNIYSQGLSGLYPKRAGLAIRSDSEHYTVMIGGDDEWIPIPLPLDATLLSTQTAGGFVGAMYGVCGVQA